MIAVVEARFAGGSITVSSGKLPDSHMPVVELDMPGANSLVLFPHEARAFADAIRAAAGEDSAHTGQPKPTHETSEAHQ